MGLPDLVLVGIGWFCGTVATIGVILWMRRRMLGEVMATSLGIQRMMQQSEDGEGEDDVDEE